MCGVVAVVDRQATAADLHHQVAAMTGTLTHRGPDDHGIWSDPAAGVALGHRRLAIRDPSRQGRQPMHSADGRWVVAYNGELYNLDELRRGLVGHRFRSGSDTEVLVESIAQRGVRPTIDLADGMFGFVAWDRRERTLWAVRDRMGIKPLYHASTPTGVLVASELRAVRRHADFRADLDPTAVHHLLERGAIGAGRTVYADAGKLPPGTLLCLRPGEGVATPQTWWDAADAAHHARRHRFEGSDVAAVDHLERLVSASVERRLVADVPLGAFLSGGIDSSLVTALLQARRARPVRTFSLGFDDPRFDEGPHAAAVARHLGTDHAALRVDESTLLDTVPELFDHLDEPLGDPSLIPTLIVSKLAREDVTVVLSGDGGDELFGGYLTYGHAERLWRTLRRVPYPVRRTVGRMASPHAGVVGRVAVRLAPRWADEQVHSRVERAINVLGGRTDTEMVERLTTNWPAGSVPVVGPTGRQARATPPIGERHHRATDHLPLMERMMLDDQRRYLPDTVLTKVDRASMAVGLEVRVPLLDHHLFDFAWRLHRNHRVRDGANKWILREVLGRYVPLTLFDRPKQGFTIPLGDWLRGPLRPWAEDLLAPAGLAAVPFLDAAAARRTWQEHLVGRPRHHAVWNLLVLLAWHRRWA